MMRGREHKRGQSYEPEKKAAELLQQSSGPLRFGNTERSVSSLTEGPPKRKKFFSESEETGGITLKTSSYKSYDDLPLFLNARTVAQVLGYPSPPPMS